MYTKDGQTVEVVKKLEEGFLAKVIYEDFSSDDEDGDFESKWVTEDRITFFESLYDRPMTEAFAKEVTDLRAEADKLSNDIAELREQKMNESGLLNKIAKFPFIQKLVDYMTGEYEFILILTRFEVCKKSQYYSSPFVKAANLEHGGWGLYKIQNRYYTSEEDQPFMPFKTMEELNAFTKAALISHVERFASNYNKSGNLKDWFEKLHRTCEAKNEHEFMELYKSKLNSFMREEEKEQAAKLEKEVQELEAKKIKLQKLQESHQAH